MNREIILLLYLIALLGGGSRAMAVSLENTAVRADFDSNGLVAIHDLIHGKDTSIAGDSFSAIVDGTLIDGTTLAAVVEEDTPTRRVFRRSSGAWTLRTIYELEPGWSFVSKRVSITSSGSLPYQLGTLKLLGAQIGPTITADLAVRDARLLRFGERGLLVTIQNPFMEWIRNGQQIAVAYTPSMAWDPANGVFLSDRVLLASYSLSGVTYPAQLGSWVYVADGTAAAAGVVDRSEVDAYAGCIRSLMKKPRTASERVHVGWTENDYQIDVATAGGRTEYKRIIDQAAAVGCRHVLYTPANSGLASSSENTDFWGFENILWLNLGQKIRKGEWTPGVNPLPVEVSEMLNYAAGKNVKLLAYVFPTLPFPQDPAWTAFSAHRADTGQRSFQDWLIQKLVDFQAATGIGGYSFDHWFISYTDAPSSRYAQWYGCRRILEELRRRVPDVVIDGRQSYQEFGPWSWLAGTYPHPLFSDEQPVSFESFPDLHWSRSSADRQRYAAWFYRNVQFCPVELMPGYMTQQTPREDAANVVRRDRFRPRDWDLLGWKYSVISSIATAPFNHVVNFIPARDTEEFAAFSAADQSWMRGWFDWTDSAIEILRNLRPILNQPQSDRVDGTAAFKDGRGFVFLFNPNYRPLPAHLRLDASIGLTTGDPFVLRQLYPDAEKGKMLAPVDGTTWKSGDEVNLPLTGASAMVLEIQPIPALRPLLFNSVGIVVLNGSRIQINGASGEPGTDSYLTVLLADGQPVSSVTVNGVICRYQQQGDKLSIPVHFPGTRFEAHQQIGNYNSNFTGGNFTARSTIPQRVFDQLSARAAGWPVSYNAQDLQATWLGSDRLLLFVNIADPDPGMNVTLQIDGQVKTLTKAYSSITGQAPGYSFVGWYADVSSLSAGVEHTFSATLPAMSAGRFQGMFFDTVEAEHTNAIEPVDKIPQTTTRVDDFSSARNYLLDGVTGTGWDGILTGAGSVLNTGLGGNGPGATITAAAGNPAAGELTVKTTSTDWEAGNDDGFLLYVTVGGDFEAQVRITAHDAGGYNYGGLMARVPDLAEAGPGEDYLTWGVFDQLGNGNFLRSTVAGVSRDFPVPADGVLRHGLKMVRRGNRFEFYHRVSSSDPWQFGSAQERPDLAGLPLQVGLMHATFSTASLTTRFDDFQIERNGLPLVLPSAKESWKQAVFGTAAGDPSVAGDLADPDGDYMINAQEFAALTNPLDSSDFAMATLTSSAGGAHTVSIPGKAGRSYKLTRSHDLASEWEEVFSSPILDQDAPVEFVVPEPAPPKVFYRFQVTGP